MDKEGLTDPLKHFERKTDDSDTTHAKLEMTPNRKFEAPGSLGSLFRATLDQQGENHFWGLAIPILTKKIKMINFLRKLKLFSFTSLTMSFFEVLVY